MTLMHINYAYKNCSRIYLMRISCQHTYMRIWDSTIWTDLKPYAFWWCVTGERIVRLLIPLPVYSTQFDYAYTEPHVKDTWTEHLHDSSAVRACCTVKVNRRILVMRIVLYASWYAYTKCYFGHTSRVPVCWAALDINPL